MKVDVVACAVAVDHPLDNRISVTHQESTEFDLRTVLYGGQVHLSCKRHELEKLCDLGLV